MVEPDFNPRVGEQVIGPPSDAVYEIVDRYTNSAGEPLLKLRRLRDGSLFDNVPPVSFLLKYPLQEQVRRALNELLAKSDEFPEDLQAGRFKVISDEMYDGTPRIVVYFYLKPGVVPSPEKARVLNDFYRKLHTEIDPLMDYAPTPMMDDAQTRTWLQFMTREARSPLSVAS